MSTIQFSSAQDWPQWRGENRDGKAAAFTPPTTWPAQLEQKWKVTVGDGVATPSLVGDKLYVFSRQDGAEVIRCLDAATGKELWQDKYDALGASGPAASFSGPRCSPVVAAGKVVTMGVRGILSCLNAEDGKLLWRKNDFADAYPRFFTSASPLVIDGLCIAEVGGGDKGGIAAYDLESGEQKWIWDGDSPAYASPMILETGGAKYVIAQTESKMAAVGLADGKLAWETPFRSERMGYNAATPIVSEQTVIYSGSNRGATAVRLEKADDKLKGEQLWQNLDNSVQFNSPILDDGRIYGLSASDNLFCVNAESGKTLWTASLNKPEAAPAEQPPANENRGGGRPRRGGGGGRGRGGYGSLVDAGPVLMALTPSAQLVVFEPSATAFTEIARIKVSDSQTYAYPVPSGKRIFVKDKDDVMLLAVP